jgi:hypothetical protein
LVAEALVAFIAIIGLALLFIGILFSDDSLLIVATIILAISFVAVLIDRLYGED